MTTGRKRPKPKSVLPSKPSDLIKMAITYADNPVEATEEVCRDEGTAKYDEDTCPACLTGAVMYTLLEAGPDADTSMPDSGVITKDDRKKLEALRLLLRRDYEDALDLLGIDKDIELSTGSAEGDDWREVLIELGKQFKKQGY